MTPQSDSASKRVTETEQKDANPWNLSRREQEVLDLWCIYGTRESVCKALGIKSGTAGTLASRAMKKIGVAHVTLALIAWDRFAYGHGESASA